MLEPVPDSQSPVDPFVAMTLVLEADLVAARASISHTRVLALRFGVDVDPAGHARRPKAYISGSKGKSKPQLEQWIERALDDGTLPRPTDNLIISDRMVRQALDQGLIEGIGHPYRITALGSRFLATAVFRKAQR